MVPQSSVWRMQPRRGVFAKQVFRVGNFTPRKDCPGESRCGAIFEIRSWEERMTSRVKFYLSLLSIVVGIMAAAGVVPSSVWAQADSDAVVYAIENLNAAQGESY